MEYVHVPRIYHAYTTHVPRMYHAYTTHIPRMYHACMYHAYTTHIPRMYHACVPNNTNKKFFVTERALVQILNLSTPGIGEHNYCRQPAPLANVDNTPWCYTTSSTRWEYCDVPACSEYNTQYYISKYASSWNLEAGDTQLRVSTLEALGGGILSRLTFVVLK